jgi:hypothetical protein
MATHVPDLTPPPPTAFSVTLPHPLERPPAPPSATFPSHRLSSSITSCDLHRPPPLLPIQSHPSEVCCLTEITRKHHRHLRLSVSVAPRPSSTRFMHASLPPPPPLAVGPHRHRHRLLEPPSEPEHRGFSAAEPPRIGPSTQTRFSCHYLARRMGLAP